jgi:hypothetical protein|tara:strand:+ start:893 stop:1234 length:342 start_codon:yes stop_codon:yes gene_type:complete
MIPLFVSVFETYWWTLVFGLWGYSFLIWDTKKEGINKHLKDAWKGYLFRHFPRALFAIGVSHHLFNDFFVINGLGYYFLSGSLSFILCTAVDAYSLPIIIINNLLKKFGVIDK